MKTLLITGALGFIGKHFITYFQAKGYRIVALEHPSLLDSAVNCPCEIFFADITIEAELLNLNLPKVDALLHLAGQSSGPRSFLIPEIDLELNCKGTLNVIKLCLKFGIKRILFASSFVVYGNSTAIMLHEGLATQPLSVYASSKLYAENILATYAEPHGINWNSLRMFNVYGEGQDIKKPDQGIVGIFLNQLIQSPIVNVKGSINRYRDLVYISDVALAWEAVLESSAYNQAFNVGSGFKTSIKTLITTIASLMGMSDVLEIIEVDPSPGDITGACASLDQITKLTGFLPEIHLSEGLSRMVNYYV